MIILKTLLMGIHVIISIMLVVVILLQASKGGGLSGTFGGQASTALFGPRGTADVLSKITQYLAGGFLVLSLTLSMIAGAGQTPQSVTQKVLEAMPAANLPAVEDLSYDGITTPGDAEADVGGVDDSAPLDDEGSE